MSYRIRVEIIKVQYTITGTRETTETAVEVQRDTPEAAYLAAINTLTNLGGPSLRAYLRTMQSTFNSLVEGLKYVRNRYGSVGKAAGK